MLTLAEPAMSSASQNGMSVECRWQQDLLKHFALNGCWEPRLFFILHSGTKKKNQTSTILYLKIVSWQADLALKCTFFYEEKVQWTAFPQAIIVSNLSGNCVSGNLKAFHCGKWRLFTACRDNTVSVDIGGPEYVKINLLYMYSLVFC